MTLKAKAQPQPDSSGLIPIILFAWLAAVAIYGIVRIGAECYEVLSDTVNGAVNLVLGG